MFWFERSNGHPRAERDGDAEKGCQKPATQQKTILNWWSGCLWAGPEGVASDEKTKGLGERNIPSFMARTPLPASEVGPHFSHAGVQLTGSSCSLI